jgi:hypothetical protein
MNKLKIAFYSNQLGERGTEVALYDYAYFNRVILNNESIIIYNRNHVWNNTQVIDKFTKKFSVFGISNDGNTEELDKILSEEGCDIIYMILYGTMIRVPTVAKVCIHSVFTCIDTPFGDVYASIAPWVNGNNGRYPHVPHMINLPNHNNDMRNELNIPSDSVVYGRYGGLNEFNIEYVHKIVYDVAKTNSKIYFIFANTQIFCDSLPNIIHLNAIVDLDEKVKFINTCDAMLWARNDGETFGLSIGEFSTKNKPIFATDTGTLGAGAYVEILKDKGIWYNEQTLKDLLIGFNREEYAAKDWNAYRDYTPENVMKVFKEVFIDSPLKTARLYPITFSIPDCKIVSSIPLKTKLLSTIIPGDRSTYTFNNETDYYNEYKSSMFAITTKKSGWDCMRHYEIIANGCIPYFPNIEACPPNTMALLPKNLLIKANTLFNKLLNKANNMNNEDINEYLLLNADLLNYLKTQLTTRSIANYVLEKTNHTKVSRILFLSGSLYSDYLRCLTLHGFKELFGVNCHDFPKISHIYKSDNMNYRDLWGQGISYSNILENELHDDNLDRTIVEDIINKRYDIVIYGSYHRGIPYYDLVSKVYEANKIIMLCGEDIHTCSMKDSILSKGHYLFIREL